MTLKEIPNYTGYFVSDEGDGNKKRQFRLCF